MPKMAIADMELHANMITQWVHWATVHQLYPSDMPIAPYPLGFSVATLAPSSSSPEYISTKDPSINQVASPVAAPEPVGAVLPKGVFPPDTIMRTQTSTTVVGSSSPGGGR